jgi:excisionase family DNA binding protein
VDVSEARDSEATRAVLRAVAGLGQALADLAAALEPFAPADEPEGVRTPSVGPSPDGTRVPTGGSEPWLNKRQVAAHLGVSTRWVEMRAADSGLPFHRVGGLNLYRTADVDGWLDRFQAASTCRLEPFNEGSSDIPLAS